MVASDICPTVTAYIDAGALLQATIDSYEGKAAFKHWLENTKTPEECEIDRQILSSRTAEILNDIDAIDLSAIEQLIYPLSGLEDTLTIDLYKENVLNNEYRIALANGLPRIDIEESIP